MSFLPAEELDDYNSDDGFIGDDFLQAYLSVQNYKSSQGSSSKIVNTNGQSSCNQSDFNLTGTTFQTPHKESRESRRQFGLRRVPNKNVFGDSSDIPSQTFYSDEDFKMAAIKGNIELVKKCLDQGIAVSQPLYCDWTALMYASNNAKVAVVEFLLGQGADANSHADLYTALMCACSATVHSEAEVLDCVKSLINAGADIDAKDRYHSTPLMLASRSGKLETVKLLLERGAKVNEQDSRGWTALTMATQKCHKTTVMALLDAGADCNIKHRDKLTVKDLAAHLPTDEMLALLERRPFIANNYGDDASSDLIVKPSNHCLLDSGDTSMKSTDLRYGELELFLYGLDLPHLLALFRKQLIDLPLLLTLTEQDLTNAGVEQVGARKKILDACQAVHKRNWEASSLVSIHFNKCISCADAVAMVANVSKHLRYIASTASYIKEQIKWHPETVMQPTDRVNPSQLLRHIDDSMKNVDSLHSQLVGLRSQLTKEMSTHDLEPADAIKVEGKKRFASSRFKTFSILCIVLGTCGMLLWKRERLLDFVK